MGVPNKEGMMILPVFDEDFEIFSATLQAEKKVDMILDMCGPPHKSKKLEESGGFRLGEPPYAAPVQVKITPVIDTDDDEMVSECGEYEEDYTTPSDMGEFEGAELEDGEKEMPATEKSPQKVVNAINNVPNQNAPELLAAVKKDIMESAAEYRKYFQSMLKKWGVNSPAQLSVGDRKKFFNAVNRGWKAKDEVSEGKVKMAAKSVSKLTQKMNAIAAARKAKKLPPLPRKVLARVASIG